MKSIKSRLRTSTLTLLLLFELATLLIFNAVVRITAAREAVGELRAVAAMMESTVRSELSGASPAGCLLSGTKTSPSFV
jgi:hypothetical protein